MCDRGDTVAVLVKIPADLSCRGKAEWKEMQVDRCIAPIVQALSEAGIHMRGSCCGHGAIGDIHLQDGRMLLILDKEQATRYITRRTDTSFEQVQKFYEEENPDDE